MRKAVTNKKFTIFFSCANANNAKVVYSIKME